MSNSKRNISMNRLSQRSNWQISLRNFVNRKYVGDGCSHTDDDFGEDEMNEFTKLYKEWKGVDENYRRLPVIYKKMPTEDNQLLMKLREESRGVFLQRRGRELLDHDELQDLLNLLEKHCTSPNHGDNQMIGYEDFLSVAAEAGPKCKPFFSATTFGKLYQADPFGRVSILQFFNYVMRKVWLHQTHIGLSLCDVTGQGYLRESDLETYILELLPSLPQLNELEAKFHSFYICTAVRKFLFFLDPMRTGYIKILDILSCGFLDDFLELRDEEVSAESQEGNWFSANSVLRVYGQFLQLDKDRNGMLSKQELSRYGTGTLTHVFLDHVFQECLTFEGEMDYKIYLDFVLAMENPHEPQALRYFLRILDIKHEGFLTAFNLKYFFRAIQDQMRMHDQEAVSFQDVRDEIFDMVKPSEPYKITLQDLIKCGKGGTVVCNLIDLNEFWTYENREIVAPEMMEQGCSSL